MPLGQLPMSNLATPLRTPSLTMANDPNSMSQDDIDTLINQASGAAPSPAPSQGTTPAKASSGPQGALGQDDIDALINQAQASEPTTKAIPAAPKPVAAAVFIDSLFIDFIDC